MTRGRNILTEEMFVFLQKAADTLKMEKMINTLDTVAVRSMDVTEALQVGVGAFIAVGFLVNLRNYRKVKMSGSNTEPVKFMEYWNLPGPRETTSGNSPPLIRQSGSYFAAQEGTPGTVRKADRRPIFFSRCCLP